MGTDPGGRGWSGFVGSQLEELRAKSIEAERQANQVPLSQRSV
jgi:hypothetical protein